MADAFLKLNISFDSKKSKKIDETQMTFRNKKGYFTCQEIINNIIKFEKIDRSKSKWFGGIDCHHVFFEGIRLVNPDVGQEKKYRISWGS